MINNILGGIAALLTGGALAAATVYGVVTSQTGAPEQSPVDSSDVAVDYGTTE